MIHTITPQGMRAMESAFMRRTGYPGLLLMEHAAQAVTRELLAITRGHALFLCGTGNNGGDGLAAARLFAQAGGTPIIWLCGTLEALQGDARTMGHVAAAMGLTVVELKQDARRPGGAVMAQDARRAEGPAGEAACGAFALPPIPPDCGAIVDALFGTGLARGLSGLNRALAERVNASGLPVVAVDMPSGVDGATGEDFGCAIQATVTVTFHRAKPGHFLFPGRARTGRLVVADIGIPAAEGAGAFDLDAPILIDDTDVSAWLPPRAMDAHKGLFGHALIIAGSMGMAGAACFCAEAALRGGAGLVTIACPAAIVPIVQQQVPCAMAVPLPGAEGRLGREAAPIIASLLEGKACVAVGPGLRKGADIWAALAPLLTWDGPQVWDADALNALAAHPGTRIPHFYATPHPGEAARLLMQPIPAITRRPMEAAQALQNAYGGTILLKGATSVITDGQRLGLTIRGGPGMAKGGSGDVLTGLAAAMLCQGLRGAAALLAATTLHGSAGERAQEKRGERAMTAQDLIAAL